MTGYSFKPNVDQVQEFIEIAGDFSNPLDLVREAISNAVDAKARSMSITFDVAKEFGEGVLVITLGDNGIGMDQNTIRSFFDLGNSSNRGNPDAIGEKGHGTKVYFNSSEVSVTTVSNGHRIRATMSEPYKKLFSRELPNVIVEEEESPTEPSGTTILIKGYNNNRREKFTHEILKDYIQWSTKLAAFELHFDHMQQRDFTVSLKGLNRKEPEVLPFGHPFPAESDSIEKLFDRH
jgi:DNA topoisomerase VI subunit B